MEQKIKIYLCLVLGIRFLFVGGVVLCGTLFPPGTSHADTCTLAAEGVANPAPPITLAL